MSELALPDIALSRDGQRAMLVQSIGTEWFPVSSRHAHSRRVEVRLRPRGPLATVRLIVTGDLPTFWGLPTQEYRWSNLSFDEALPELGMAAIGEFLESAPVPEQPDPVQFAADVLLDPGVLQLFGRTPEEDDARLLRYIAGKLFWGFRLGIDEVRFSLHDALRFGLKQGDLHHVARQGEGVLWVRKGQLYEPQPRLLTDFRSGALPGLERPPVEKAADLLDRARYPAAFHHLEKANALLRSEGGDLPNAAKEAVAAVESLGKVLLQAPGNSLGECINALRKKALIPQEVAKILQSLYAYRNSTPGVGHGGVTVPAVSQAEAKLILGVAAEAISYLDSLWPELRGEQADS